MHLKLGIILERKPNINNLDSIVEDILYPYLSDTPIRELILKDCNKNDMKEKYKSFKEEYYRGVSPKKRKEDMVNKGVDTLEGFCKNQYGIIKFNDDGDAVIPFNSNAFIDEYEINSLVRVKDLEEDFLAMNLKALIDKDLKVYHRELQTYKVTPSTVLKPIVGSLKKTDYVIIVNYIF